MKNKSLQVRKENIFTKFMDFVKKIFKKKETKENTKQEPIVNTTEENKSDFFEKYRVHQENSELLNLQNQFEKGEIDLCTMSNEEVRELNLLYKRQILDLNARLNNKKAELNRIQYNEKQSTNS